MRRKVFAITGWTIWTLLCAIVGIFVVRMVAVFMRSYCMDYIGRNVINSLRKMMFENADADQRRV